MTIRTKEYLQARFETGDIPTGTNFYDFIDSSVGVLETSGIADGMIDPDLLPIMGASGASHAPGAVPDPGATSGTTKFLREDGTWNVPAGASSGTVTSIAMTVPAEFSVSGSPITSSGTLAITLATQSANTVFAGPTSGGAATPTFRVLTVSDMPSAVVGGLNYQGTWNASTNSPTIPAASSGNKGQYYKVSVAGTTTIDGISEWAVGDWIVSNGTAWDKIDNTENAASMAAIIYGVTAKTTPADGDVFGYLDSAASYVLKNLTWANIKTALKTYFDGLYGTIATAKYWERTVACSDETTALTTGTAKVTFRMPCAVTLSAVRLSATTAPTGAALIVDVNEGGASIFSTNPRIDAGAKTSTSSGTPAVISDTALADDAEITIDIDQVGSTVAGAGLKVTLIGTRT